MRIAILLPALLLAGCSSAPDPLPTSCDRSKIVGSYLAHFVTVSGNCGAIPDQVFVAGGTTADAGSGGCHFTTDTISQGGCRADFVEDCRYSDGTGPELRGYLVIQDANADVLRGEVTWTLYGNPQCVGTYDVTYTRQ